jgi:hypothetical protein
MIRGRSVPPTGKSNGKAGHAAFHPTALVTGMGLAVNALDLQQRLLWTGRADRIERFGGRPRYCVVDIVVLKR